MKTKRIPLTLALVSAFSASLLAGCQSTPEINAGTPSSTSERRDNRSTQRDDVIDDRNERRDALEDYRRDLR